MTMVLSPGESADDLVTRGNDRCPRCSGELRRWGWARARMARGRAGERAYRPSRVRCRSCRVTQVVLPPDVLVRRRDEVAVIGEAWRAHAAGAGARRTAGSLGLPMETVRGWLRRLRALLAAAGVGGGSARDRARLRRGLSLATAAAAARGWTAEGDLWRFVSSETQGRLLDRNTSWPSAWHAGVPMT